VRNTGQPDQKGPLPRTRRSLRRRCPPPIPVSAACCRSLNGQLPDADSLMMIENEPRPRASSDRRQALTVALVKPGRGSCLKTQLECSYKFGVIVVLG
jgi:hypothetical protein